MTKDIKVWFEESVLSLQECFDCTDWDTFTQSCGDDLDSVVDVTCSYITFVSCKWVKIYPNNKPWVNKAVKSGLQRKSLAFKQGIASVLHSATK